MSPLEAELASFAGARIDAAHASPETGLVVLSIYAGEKRLLGLGIGPVVAGIGLLPALPRLRAAASHPLVAALRAHLVGHRVREVVLDADGLVVVAGGESVTARLVVVPGKRGCARVLSATGALVVEWPPGAKALAPGAFTMPDGDLAGLGARLVEESDGAAAAKARTSLLRAAKARVLSLARRREAVRGDLARVAGALELQKTGRLLQAQGARIPKGAARATLDDWESGGSLEVELDPARPAKAQAEGFFARARRFQRGEAVMRKRLEETARALADAEALLGEIEATPASPGAVEALLRRPSLQRPEPAAKRRARDEPPARVPFHVYRSAGGERILVGRGAKDNDALTTGHAKPHDLWLHAKGVVGAHVVVPRKKGEGCPADLLVDAATLAAHHSDARGEGVVDVSYVDRRHVRKPKGSAPGAVTLSRESVVAVRMEPRRLERLLASKEER